MAQSQSAADLKAASSTEMLLGEQFAGVGKLGHEVAAIPSAGMVDDGHGREMTDVPTSLPEAVAPINLLGVEEEVLVHGTDRDDGPRASHEKGSDQPVD